MTETPGDGAQIGGAYFGLGFDFSQLEKDLDRAESLTRSRVQQIQSQIDQITRAAGASVNVSARVAQPRPINVRQQVIVTRVMRVVDAPRPASPKTPDPEHQVQNNTLERRWTIVTRTLPGLRRPPTIRQIQDIELTRNAHVVRESRLPAPRDPARIEQQQEVDVRRSARVTEAPTPSEPKAPQRVDQTQLVRLTRRAVVAEAQLPPVKQPPDVHQQQFVRVTRHAVVTEAQPLAPPPNQPDIAQVQNVHVRREYFLEHQELPRFPAPIPERLTETQAVVVRRDVRLEQEEIQLPAPRQLPAIELPQPEIVHRRAEVKEEGQLPPAPNPPTIDQTQTKRVRRRTTVQEDRVPAPPRILPDTQQTQRNVVNRRTFLREFAAQLPPPQSVPAIFQTQDRTITQVNRVVPAPTVQPPAPPPAVNQTENITVTEVAHKVRSRVPPVQKPADAHLTEEVYVTPDTHVVGGGRITVPALHPLPDEQLTRHVEVETNYELRPESAAQQLPPPKQLPPIQQVEPISVERPIRVIEGAAPPPPKAPQGVRVTSDNTVVRHWEATDEPVPPPKAVAPVQQSAQVNVNRHHSVKDDQLPPPAREPDVQQQRTITVDEHKRLGRTDPEPPVSPAPKPVRQRRDITIEEHKTVRQAPEPNVQRATAETRVAPTPSSLPTQTGTLGEPGARQAVQPGATAIRAEFDRLVRPVIEQAIQHFGRPQDIEQLPEIVATELEAEFSRFTQQASQHVAQAPDRQAAVRTVAESLRNLPEHIRQQLGGLPEPTGAPQPSRDLEQIVQRAIFGTPNVRVARQTGQTQQRVLVVDHQQTIPTSTPLEAPQPALAPREPSPSRTFTRPTRTYGYEQRGETQQLQVGAEGATLRTFLGPNQQPEVRQLTRSEAAQRLLFQRTQRLPQGIHLGTQDIRRVRSQLRRSTPPGRISGPDETVPRSVPEVEAPGPRPLPTELRPPTAAERSVTPATPVVLEQPSAETPRQQPLPPAPRVIEPPRPAVVRRFPPLPPAAAPFTPGPARVQTAPEESNRSEQDAEQQRARQAELARRVQETGRRPRTYQYERRGQQIDVQTGLNPTYRRGDQDPTPITRESAARILRENRARLQNATPPAPAPTQQAAPRDVLQTRDFEEATHIISLENRGRPGRQYFVGPDQLDQALRQLLPRISRPDTTAFLQERERGTGVLSRDVQLTQADIERRLGLDQPARARTRTARQAPASVQAPAAPQRTAVEVSREIDRLTNEIRQETPRVANQRRVAQSAPAREAADVATDQLAMARRHLEELQDELRSSAFNIPSQQQQTGTEQGVPPGVARLRSIQGRAPRQQPTVGFFPVNVGGGQQVLLPTGTPGTQQPQVVQPEQAPETPQRAPQLRVARLEQQRSAADGAADALGRLRDALNSVSQQEDRLSQRLRVKNTALQQQVAIASDAYGALERLPEVVGRLADAEAELARRTREANTALGQVSRQQQTAPAESPQPRAPRRRRQQEQAPEQPQQSPINERVTEVRASGLALNAPEIQQPAGPLIVPAPRGTVRTGEEAQQRITDATRQRTLEELGLVTAGPPRTPPQPIFLPNQPPAQAPQLVLPNQPPPQQPLILPSQPTVPAQQTTRQAASVPVPQPNIPGVQGAANSLFQQMVAGGVPVAQAVQSVQSTFGVAPNVQPGPATAPTPTPRLTRAQAQNQQQVQQRLAIATGAPFSTLTGRLVAPPGFTVPPQFQGPGLTATGVPLPPQRGAGVQQGAGAQPQTAAQQLATVAREQRQYGPNVPGGQAEQQQAGPPPILRALGFGNAATPLRVGLGLAGIPIGINIISGLARDLHNVVVGAVADADSLTQSFREISIAYGQIGQQQLAGGASRFLQDPGTRGTSEQYQRAAASLQQLNQQYGFTTQQISGVLDASGRLARLHEIELPQASQILQQALQGDTSAAQQLGISLTDNTGRLRGVGVSYDELATIIGRARASQVVFQEIQNQTARQSQSAIDANNKTADSLDRIGKAADQLRTNLTNLVTKPYEVVVTVLANLVSGFQQDASGNATAPHPIGQPNNPQLEEIRRQRLTQPTTATSRGATIAAEAGNNGLIQALVDRGIIGPEHAPQQRPAPLPAAAQPAVPQPETPQPTAQPTPQPVPAGAFTGQLVAPGTDLNRRPIGGQQQPPAAPAAQPQTAGAAITTNAQQAAGQPPAAQPAAAGAPAEAPKQLDFSSAAAATGLTQLVKNYGDAVKDTKTAIDGLISSTDRLTIANQGLIGTAQQVGSIASAQAAAQRAATLAQAAEGPNFPLAPQTDQQVNVIAQQRAGQIQAQLNAQATASVAQDAFRAQLQTAATTGGPAVPTNASINEQQQSQQDLDRYDRQVEAQRQIVTATHDQAVAQHQSAQAQAAVDILSSQNEQARLAAQTQVNDLTLQQIQLQNSLAPILLQEANIRDQITLATRENLDLTERRLRAEQSSIPASRALETANFQEQEATQRAVVSVIDRMKGRPQQFDINDQIQTITGIEFQKPQLELNNTESQRQLQLAQQAQADFQLGQQLNVIPQQRELQGLQPQELQLQAESRGVQAQSDALGRALQASELSRAPALIEAQSEMLNARLEEIHATLKANLATGAAAGLPPVTVNVTVPGNINLDPDFVSRLKDATTSATLQALIDGRNTSGQRVQTSVPGGR